MLDFSLHISNIYWVLLEIQRSPVYWQFYQALHRILLCVLTKELADSFQIIHPIHSMFFA